MKANFKRNIKPGTEFNSFFPSPKHKVIDLGNFEVDDTLELMQKYVLETLDETKKIAKVLKGSTNYKTAQNIWEFIYNHIQYKPDAQGIEQLRTPARTWFDRNSGVDCDCYSIFISSILTNLGINHFLRIAEYNNKGYYQHVYVVIPKNGMSLKGRSTYIVIDPVVDHFDYEEKFTKIKDKKMSIPHQLLNGIDSGNEIILNYGTEFDSVDGLGAIEDKDFDDRVKQHLINTLVKIKTSPESISNVANPEVFAEQLAYAIENWDDPIAREAVLEELEEMEDMEEEAPETTITGLGFALKTRLVPVSSSKSKIKALRARRKMNKRIVPATYQRGTIQKNPHLRKACHEQLAKGMKLVISLEGLGKRKRKGKFFSKIKKATKAVKSKIQSTAKKAGTKIKSAAQKTKEFAKKAGKAIVRFNPATIAIRNGFLLAMRINFLKLAERLKWGYLSEQQAVEKGLDINEFRKLKATLMKIEKIFEKLGGKKENLKNAILKSKHGSINGLGAVAATGVTAASGVLAKVASFLKKINFKKLFEKAKKLKALKKVKDVAKNIDPSLIDKIRNKLKNKKFKPSIQTPSGEKSLTVNNDALINSADVEVSNDIQSKSAVMPNENTDATNDSKKSKSSTGLYIGIGTAVLLAGTLIFKSKNKGVNGVEVITV